jgi:hypothetical protein
VVFVASAPASAQNGPVAAYSFNEASGTSVFDNSGNGNAGVVAGAAWNSAGKFGSALAFNGISNWVTINDAAKLDLTTGMTLEAWVKPTALADWRTVLMKESSNGLAYALYASDSSSHPSGWIRRSSDVSAIAASALPLNTWSHLAATYDGVSLRLFLNGTQVATRAVSGAVSVSASPLRIGGNSVWSEYFAGLIDEVRIYNRALAAAEIQTDMTTPIGGTPPPPTGWSLSGAISPAVDGNGATVNLSGAASASSQADSNGNFLFPNLPNGTYTVTPTKGGVTMSPANQTVTISNADLSGVQFTATAAPPATGAIRLVQKGVNGSESSVSSISATFPSSNTAGNFLIVTGTAARPAGTLTISDTLGNTYLPAIGPITDGPQDVTAYIWYVPICRGGVNTVTVRPGSARALEIHVSEWSGLATNAPVDQTASLGGFGTQATSGSRTTTVNGELIFGYTFIGNNATEGAGYTRLSLVNGDMDEYLVQSSAGPVEATFTQQTGDWFVLLATFKPAAVIVDTTPPTVSITAPQPGTTVNSTVMLAAEAADDFGVSGVQFQVDGSNLGAEVVVPPYRQPWDTTLIADGVHTIRAIARDAAGNTMTSTSLSITVSNTTNPAVVGEWAPSFDVGMVAVNMVMLRTGKVLMFSGSYSVSDTERVWDPATGAITLVPNPFYNLFCAGQAQLPDGRILVAGGYDPNSLGAANANIFDPVSLQWSALPNMAFRRWYPTVTTLPDGRMLVMSGGTTCLTCLVDVPEVFDPATNRFTQLTGSRLAAPYYPFMYVLPDGRVIDAGANEQPFETHALNLGTGAWTMIDSVVKDGHSSVMYRPGKILKTGTASDSGKNGNAAATAYVLDMTLPDASWRQVASMAFPRAFQNSTLLPDGNVLVTGGGTALDGYDVSKGVLAAEMWSPATETWKTLSKGAYSRLYHSTALLLPDARVLIAGSGDDGPAVNNRRAEIYSPPYLFKGSRPTYSGAPGTVQYGASFTLQSADAASIASVALVRPGSVTHAFDQDQRYVPLAFTASANALTVQAPANANLAPPGYYMLFIVNSSGVPSVASFVLLPSTLADSQPPTIPGNLTAQGAVSSVSLSWAASTDNVGLSVYNVHRSTVSGFAPTLSTRIAQTVDTTYTNAALSQGTYFYVVTAQDVAGNVSGASNEAGATVFGDTNPPSVSMISPLDQTAVSGSITISANASDDVGVVGVQFRLDGSPLGAEKTSPPYSLSWNSASTTNGSHTLSALARDSAGNTRQASVTVAVSNAAQSSGLVAALGFNEGSGSLTTDASGLGNNGALVNGAGWSAAGHTGAAISFSANGWVNIPDAASLDLTTGMTVEAWVRPTSGTGWRTVLLKEATSALSYGLYSANGASRPGIWTRTGTADYFVLGTGAVPTNAWTHLAATYDGAALRFFVNGVQVATKTGVGTISTSTGPLRIGGNSVWGEYFRGLIDDVRIYNRALSAAEIQIDMNTGIQ